MIIADLHIHSRYSRATARDLDPEHLWISAQRKGIDLLGTGDLTHPAWLEELEEKLVPTGDGGLCAAPGTGLRPGRPGARSLPQPGALRAQRGDKQHLQAGAARPARCTA